MTNGMVVLRVPRRLRASAMVLFFSVVLTAIQVMIEARAPWWRLPYSSMVYWSITCALIGIPLYSWLLSGKRWAYHLTVCLSVLWIISSGWISIQTRNPSLGFFTLSLMTYFLFALLWLRFETNKSFFNPQICWYQSLPRPIHGLTCQVRTGKQPFDYRVSRIDEEGTFIYSNVKDPALSVGYLMNQARPGFDLVFNFRDQKIECRGLPILALGEGRGLGLQFMEMTADQKKDVGDFIENLRVQGLI